MKTNRFARYLAGVAASWLLVGCGGGGDAPGGVPMDADASLCRSALIERGVATDSMLNTAVYTVVHSPQLLVRFHNDRAETDPEFHVFGSCLIENGTATRVGQ